MSRFLPDPLNPGDWRNYIFPPATMGPGLLESGIRAIAGEGNIVSRRGPKTPVMDRLKQEIARQHSSRDKKQKSSTSSMDEIMARLEAIQDPSRFMADPETLRAQARAAAEAQYGPLIAQLRGKAEAANLRGNRGKEEIGRMYSSLASDYAARVPVVQQQYTDTKQNTAQQYQDLQSNINQQYADSMKQQEEIYKRLGIEAAAPSTLPDQQRDQNYFASLAAKEGQTAQTALGMEERGATEFTARGSDIARYEGTARQADIMAALEEYLREVDSEIASQNAAMENASNANFNELQTGMASQAQKRAQQEFDNYLASIRLGRDLRKDELSQIAGVKVGSPADVASRVLNLGLTPNDAQSVQDVFNQAIGSDDFILGGLNTQSGTPATKEALAARIVELGRQHGLTRSQLNALQIAALEYYGRQ